MKQLLLVSADVEFRESVKGSLVAESATVQEADTLAGMKAILDSSALDLVVLDVELPPEAGSVLPVNGMKLLREIRREHGLEELPVIVATSLDNTQMMSNLLQGYTAYLKREHILSPERLLRYVRPFLKEGRLDFRTFS